MGENDVDLAYWYALGWRGPGGMVQVDNADINGDGDGDIRDGFLIDAFRSSAVVSLSRLIAANQRCPESRG